MIPKSKEKVMKWIKKQFIEDRITTKDFPVLPGGTIVRDKEGGEMFVFFDALTDSVKYQFRGVMH